MKSFRDKPTALKIVKTSKPAFNRRPTSGSYYVNDGQGGFTLINDVDPANDLCSSATDTTLMTGKNIGDLLNDAEHFMGRLHGRLQSVDYERQWHHGLQAQHVTPVVGQATADYVPHHNWFQYFASTANPPHARPSSTAVIGLSLEADGKTPEPANHQYDTDDFFASVKAGNFPSVSFIKAPAFQDGHAGYSDPLDEQAHSHEDRQLPAAAAGLERAPL